jgi:hypothetical protein
MMEELDELTWMASFVDSLFSGILHIPKLTSLNQRLWKASKFLALLSFLLETLCLVCMTESAMDLLEEFHTFFGGHAPQPWFGTS